MPAGAGKTIPVKVALRCRPLIPKETLEGCKSCVQFIPNEPQLMLNNKDTFTFDYVFDPTTPQDEVYKMSVQSLVDGIFEGYNATVLAYGQTGSGKTYSMGGGYGVSMETIDDDMGIIPRVIRDLFERIDTLAGQIITVRCSYLEIYNEDLLDLLVPMERREKDAVTIREDDGGIKLKGLTEQEVSSVESTIGCLESGSITRTTGCTAMNNSSSRSHAIFTIHVDRVNKADEHDHCKSKFHLVDLAGSERCKKTKAVGVRFQEGVNINKGLLALGNVINALGNEEQRAKHIPYRDSKLTRLLQDSLGGNSRTVMIACVSPADSNADETKSTLSYADRVRKIKNKPVVNRDPHAVEIQRLNGIIQQLQMALLETGRPMKELVNIASSSQMSSSLAPRTDSAKVKILEERIKELEGENKELKKENSEMRDKLNEHCNVHLKQTEKVINLEFRVEEYKTKFEELRLMGQQVEASFNEAAGDDKTQTAIKELTMKLQEPDVILVPNDVDDVSHLDNDDDDDNDAPSFNMEDGAIGGDDRTADLKRKHQETRSKYFDDIKALEEILDMKKSLAIKMEGQESQNQALKERFEKNVQELEEKYNEIAREKDMLEQQLRVVKVSGKKDKLAEERRIKLKELEKNLANLKKEMAEKNRVIKQTEEQLKKKEKLQLEILTIKRRWAALSKEATESNKRFQNELKSKNREVNRLKAKESKQAAENAKLQRQLINQKTVAKRKNEDAAIAQRRLKEALMKKSLVQKDRIKRQAASDSSAYSTRLKRWLNEELGLAVATEEARQNLEHLKTNRKELAEEAAKLRSVLDDSSQQPPSKRKQSSTNSIIDTSQYKQDTEKKIKELETEIELISVQIQGLNEKLSETTDQTAVVQAVMAQVSSLAEGRTAVRILMTKLINSILTRNKIGKELEHVQAEKMDLDELVESNEDALKAEIKQADELLMKTRQEYELKVLFLMDQLNQNDKHMEDHPALEEQTKQKIKFQTAEIKRLHNLQDALESKTVECERLRQELTALNYKHLLLTTPGRDIPSAPGVGGGEFSFFSPVLTGRPNITAVQEEAAAERKKRSNPPVKFSSLVDSEDEENALEDDLEDDDNDPDWQAGLTPGVSTSMWPKQIRKKSRSQRSVINEKMEDVDEVKESRPTKRKARPR